MFAGIFFDTREVGGGSCFSCFSCFSCRSYRGDRSYRGQTPQSLCDSSPNLGEQNQEHSP